MRVRVNGHLLETACDSLHGLLAALTPRNQALVVVLNGYQTDADAPLQENDEIVWLPQGVPPNAEQLEIMLTARHTPGIHARLKQARVAVAGLGGLGSLIALSLARCGIGHLHLIDFDIVEPTNLNRQQYRLELLGLPKATALAREIAAINPFVNVYAVCERVTEVRVAELFHKADIICEAFDDPAAKAMLANSLLMIYPEKPLVAASGMAGYGRSNAIITKRIRNNFYLCGDGLPAAEPGRGLMAPRVAICAGHQANLVLELILQPPENCLFAG